MSNGFFGFLKNNDNNTNNLSNKSIVVKANRCPQNHSCPSVRVCPTGALYQKGFKAPEVNLSKCTKCGKCTKSCMMRAIVFE